MVYYEGEEDGDLLYMVRLALASTEEYPDPWS